MPFRWQKRIKIAPGVKVSLSPKGVRGVSIGGKHGRVNVNRRGSSFGTSIGGGLSYSTPLGKRRGKKQAATNDAEVEATEEVPVQAQKGRHGCLWWMTMIFLGFLLISCILGPFL